jgi:hypothetical protein
MTRAAAFARRPSLALWLVLALLPPAAGVHARQSRGGARGLKAAGVSTLPAKSKRYALVVGVDRYDDGQITPLGGASNDARSLADALVRHAGFPAEQVVLLASDQPAERQPTRGQILRRLSNLASLVPKDGLLLFSFAGHGMDRGGQAYLLPSDAQVNGNAELLEMTAVNASQVAGWIQKTGVRQALLLLDACRDDPTAARSFADNRLTGAYLRAFDFDARNRGVEAFATLYATALGARAYEYREKKQGYFTWALVEGLKGGAADARGEVTLARLIKFVQERVPRQVALDLGADREQRPFAVVGGFKADELVIAFTKAAENAPQISGATTDSERSDETAVGARPPEGASPSPVIAAAKSSRSKEKAGRVLLLTRRTGGNPGGTIKTEGEWRYEAFWQVLSRKLVDGDSGAEALSTSVVSDSGEREETLALLRRLERGDRSAGRKLPYAVVVISDVTVTRREPFDGLQIAEASATLKALDGDGGEILAQEEVIAARGFGNTPSQAEEGALKAAGEQVSGAFVARVRAAAR